MNISPVSFRSAANTMQKTDFNALVSRPQTYSQSQTPVAATNINGNGNKKSPVKKFLGFLLAATGIAATIGLGSKFGIFNPKEGGNKIIEQGKGYLKTAGEQINKYAGKAYNFGKNLFENIKSHLNKETVQDAVEDVVENVAEQVTT